MKNYTTFLVFCILFVCSIPRTSQSCTSFCLDNNDQSMFGKNFDSPSGEGLVIVNKRGVSKTAMTNPEDPGQPISWTSQFGSVTFTHVAREFPFGGMNKAGLVVELMNLMKTKYPEPDSRPYSSGLQWIQYQLDNFSTVEEVITSDSQLRITVMKGDHGSHYLVSDRRGNCASIEFLDGKMVYHTKGTMPVKVLSNSTYEECILYWKQDEIPTPDYADSVKRFITAADMLVNYDPETSGSATDYAFSILSSVPWFNPTQWSIVYDIQNLRIYFHTLDNEQIRYFDLSSFDFSCKTPVKVLDIKEALSGDISNEFVDYTYEINRDLIEKVLPDDFSDEEIDALANYPETTVCMENCFIVTAAYGSPMEPRVEVLREFRDRFLLNNTLGKVFVQLYNTYSLPLANFIAGHDNLREVVRLSLLPMVGMSWITLRLGLIPTTSFLILLLLTLILSTLSLTSRKRAER